MLGCIPSSQRSIQEHRISERLTRFGYHMHAKPIESQTKASQTQPLHMNATPTSYTGRGLPLLFAQTRLDIAETSSYFRSMYDDIPTPEGPFVDPL